MEQKWVINPGLAIWVTEYSWHQLSPPVWKADGVAMDGYHGFGESDIRSFNGQVALFFSKEKSVQSLSIWLAHFSRQGFKWLLEGGQELPRPPFLISYSTTHKIFDGEVRISKNQDVIDLSEPDDYIYPVGTRSWFGVLKVKDDKKVHLIAFSSSKDAKISEGDEMWSFEWDCLAGKITTVENFNW